jgi:hypothetical protein
MVVVLKTRNRQADEDSVFDDPDRLIALAERSFEKAARAEVARNDSLGLPTHGAVGGKLVVRRSPGARTTHQP